MILVQLHFRILLSSSYFKMLITPLSQSYNTNWLNLHNKHCNYISNSNYLTLLIGHSLIAGLSRYPNSWKRYFKPLNAIVV